MSVFSDIRGLDKIPASDMPVRAAAPVESWHPEHSAPIDIRIDVDGQWFHDGSAIRRASLVALFASILRCEPDGSYVLVTPAEKRTIKVEDVPFVVVDMAVQGEGRDQLVQLTTNLGEQIAINDDHQMRFAESTAAGGVSLPYVTVRGGLEARFGRAVFADLVDIGSVNTQQGEDWFGVWSGGAFWPMMLAADAGVG